MTAAPMLHRVVVQPHALTLNPEGFMPLELDPELTLIELDGCNPSQPLPRLLQVRAITGGEEAERVAYTFQVDRVGAAGRAVLAALGFDRLAVPVVSGIRNTGGGRMVLCYRVSGERVEWVIHAPVAHMIAGRTSEGLLWLKVFYLDALDAPAGPTLAPPSADFLVTADQWQELMPVLAGLSPD